MPNSTSSTTERRVPGGLLWAGLLAGILWGAATPLRADLTPAARALETRGLNAAREGDWPTAISSLSNARWRVWDDPALMFDLGLANERAGNPAAAILWWRAYLIADPGAANAGAVRAEQARLATGMEAAAHRKFREAVAAALRLSDERPRGTGRSLRRAAFDDILTQVYRCGLVALGDEISARARAATPGERDSDAVVMARKSRGLWGLTQAFDERRVRALRRKIGGPGVNQRWDREVAEMYALLGQPEEAAKWLGRYSGVQLRRSFGFVSDTSTVAFEMYFWGGGDAADRILVRLEEAPGFDADVYKLQVSLAEQAFWNGAHSLSRKMAGEALGYFRRAPQGIRLSDDYVADQWLAYALTGQWDALEVRIIGWGIISQSPANRWTIENDLAAITAATAGDRAAAVLKDLADALARTEGLSGDEPNNPADHKLHEQNPILDIATELVGGNETLCREKVAAWTRHPDAPAGAPEPQTCLDDTLQLAVAFGRTDLALAAAQGLSDGHFAAAQLRLLERKVGYKDRRRIESLMQDLRGTRLRPTREQDLELQALTNQAVFVQALTGSYVAVPKDARTSASGAPEQLPWFLAYYGALDYVAALVWRAE